MSRPTTRRSAAQSRINTDPDFPNPDPLETELLEDGPDVQADERDEEDPVADTPNVSARELMEILGRALAGRAAAVPTPPSVARPIKVNPPDTAWR